jgi:hypothetical protein
MEEGWQGWQIPDALQTAIDKVNQGDDLTIQEERDWLEYYLFIISDNFTLSSKDLLSDHDWWLKCIQYHSDIDEDKMQQFLDKIPELQKQPLEDFLGFVVTYFTIDELKAVNFD